MTHRGQAETMLRMKEGAIAVVGAYEDKINVSRLAAPVSNAAGDPSYRVRSMSSGGREV
jgi:hypothetical protein